MLAEQFSFDRRRTSLVQSNGMMARSEDTLVAVAAAAASLPVKPAFLVSEISSDSVSETSTPFPEHSPEYLSTSKLDELRTTEYGYLDDRKQTYLDYTGSGLASRTQINANQRRLQEKLCGNPHSVSPSSLTATKLVEETRARILKYLNAAPDEYAAIFTANATGAARLVGEAYPWRRHRRLILTSDNHNSINGLREFASRHKTRTAYVRCRRSDLRVEENILCKALKPRSSLLPGAKGLPGRSGLFAYPAQSNFTGVRHPLEWVSLAQQNGYDVLLDAAAYLPTSKLDLSTIKPEFVIMSWYKLFGLPTGVGCLVVKRSALARMKRPWFSGGTVEAVSTGVPWHQLADGEAAFEDGTVNFMSIPDVHVGLDWIDQVGMPLISMRVRSLTESCLERLMLLRHSDGTPMTTIYGPTNMRRRGGTVAFNFLDAKGKIVDERLVALEASAEGISLRSGCFCNPGCGEDAFGLDVKVLRSLSKAAAPSIDEYIRLVGLQSGGAIRVSFGIASNAEDLDRFFEFAVRTYRDRVTTSEGLPPR